MFNILITRSIIEINAVIHTLTSNSETFPDSAKLKIPDISGITNLSTVIIPNPMDIQYGVSNPKIAARNPLKVKERICIKPIMNTGTRNTKAYWNMLPKESIANIRNICRFSCGA